MFLPSQQLKVTNNKGFTLIELMVVVSIIAILSVVGVTVFSGVSKNARDARRKVDIEAIAKALEVSRTSTGYVSIDGTKFSAGTVPVDSGNGLNTYCVLSNITLTPPTPIATAWINTATCPSNFSSVTTTSVPMVAGATSWTVCASLEGSTPFCKQSTQ